MVECLLLTRKEFHGGEKGSLHLFGRTHANICEQGKVSLP